MHNMQTWWRPSRIMLTRLAKRPLDQTPNPLHLITLQFSQASQSRWFWPTVLGEIHQQCQQLELRELSNEADAFV